MQNTQDFGKAGQKAAGCWLLIVEGINGRNQEHENQMALSLYQNYPVSFVGGSDSHTPEELGGVATRIGGKIRTRSDLIEALKEGNFSLHPEAQR